MCPSFKATRDETHVTRGRANTLRLALSGQLGEEDAAAKELAAKEGFELGSVRSYFKANSKALAELESDGLMKLLFNKATGEVLGAHIYGLHAADLIQEIANAVARRQSVKQLATEVHPHPTLTVLVEVAHTQVPLAPPS